MSSTDGFDTERNELLISFTLEGRELLDDVEPLLVQIEQLAAKGGEEDPETLNRVFRLFHSIKGGAGFLDLKTVGKVTHAAETLLDMFRKGKAAVQSDHIDVLNQTCDFLRNALDDVERSGTDSGLNSVADRLVSALESTIGALSGQPKKETQDSAPPPVTPIINFEDVSIAEERLDQDLSETAGFTLEITAEMVKAFRQEADELLESAEGALLLLEKGSADETALAQAFRAFHSFKGNAGFLGYVDLERLGHKAENALDLVRSNEVIPDNRLFDLLLKLIDFLRQGVLKIDSGQSPTIPAAPGLISLLEEAVEKARKRKLESDAAGAEHPVRRAGEPAYSPPYTRRAGERDPDRGSVPQGEAADVVEIKSSQGESASQKQSVRVEVAKLDALLDLVGELVIAEAMVTHSPDIRSLGIPLDKFDRATVQLNKITRSLQDVVTAVRMIPLSGTLKRMIRLVRDLSQKAGKKVDLEILGEQTEVDKSVIEQISDPLVHIIRNAIDHGIDLPEERARARKSVVGKLTIEAKYVGGEVWISVIDDGRGLNRAKIISRARERGLLDGDGSDLTDDTVWQFIFLPGFSTAEKVTDVSGRGVGMDVVRRNIEGIRGKVDIHSRAGEGTTITMRIPLTLAIIDGMVAKVGKSLYTIPTVDIQKSLRPSPDQITVTPDGKKILNLRGKLLPIVDLGDRFGVVRDGFDASRSILVVVETDHRSVCLGVDELLGQQQVVIKGLTNYVGELTGISGCTILGGGEISLILDTAGLVKSLEDVEAA